VLNEQLRRILFWVTVVVIGVVIVSGMVIILSSLVQRDEEAGGLSVVPIDITLCQEGQALFTIDPPLSDVEWAATGGTIDTDGAYTAGIEPGDYEVLADGPDRERGRAVVHVVICTPTPTIVPTPIPTIPPTPTTPPTPIPEVDPVGDVGVYSTGAPAAQPPDGIDIRNASVTPDLHISLTAREGVPTEIEEWAQEGESVLWIALNSAIPESFAARTDWLFALDLDGNTATGRPVDSARINPDLGMEVALGLYYDPGGAYVPYFLVWDPNVGDWVDGPEEVRYTISEDRTLVALAVPLGTLQAQVAQVTGVTMVPGGVKGRAAAVYYTTPEPLIDFYPDRP
jgi:hypothetical protein